MRAVYQPSGLDRLDPTLTRGECADHQFKFARSGNNPEAQLSKALDQAADRQYGVQGLETRLMRVGQVFSEDKRRIVAYGTREVRGG